MTIYDQSRLKCYCIRCTSCWPLYAGRLPRLEVVDKEIDIISMDLQVIGMNAQVIAVDRQVVGIDAQVIAFARQVIGIDAQVD